MSLPSFKKQLIQSFACLPSFKELEGNELVVVTPLGLIVGTLAKTSAENSDDKDLIASTFLAKLSMEFCDKYREENSLDKEQPLANSDGFLSLTDVTIKTSNNTFNLGFLNVFFDQIIGITIGT